MQATEKTTENAPMLTPEEVSQRTGLSTNTLANWRSRGIGPSWVKLVGEIGKTGGVVRYYERGLDLWLQRERGMTADQMKLYLAARLRRRETASSRRGAL